MGDEVWEMGKGRPSVVPKRWTRAAYEQLEKLGIFHSYARAGIPEYWILNLIDRQLEVYRNPGALPESSSGFGYRLRLVVSAGEEVSGPGLTRPITVDDLLP